ncbi:MULTISPECIES: hypothetical protein [unclassified Anabaena]|nr:MULTISPECIES: hypothetical protein [unclassified Anabaena]
MVSTDTAFALYTFDLLQQSFCTSDRLTVIYPFYSMITKTL